MRDPELDQLRSRLPVDMVRDGAGDIDAVPGRVPLATLLPSTTQEVIAAVRAAHAAGLALLPCGGGRALGLRRPPGRAYVILSTARLDGIVDYPADDLTVTVAAGTTIRTLDTALAGHDQWLPVESHDPAGATVGGLVATDSNGPLRPGHGSVRDYLLGARVVDGTGRLLRVGGQVVKNVAGYDLGKLLIGARGSLGIIVEATFRVVPLPERSEWVLGTVADVETGLELLRVLGRQGVAPVAIEILAGEARSWSPGGAARIAPLPGGTLRCCIAVEGFEAEVDWKRARILEALGGIGSSAVTAAPELAPAALGDEAEAWHSLFFEYPVRNFSHQGSEVCAVRAAVLPSRLPALCAAWQAVRVDAGICLSPGTGVARARVEGASPSDGIDLARAAEELGGHARYDLLPASWSGQIDPDGTKPSAAVGRLARDIAAVFDPHGLLPPVEGVPDA